MAFLRSFSLGKDFEVVINMMGMNKHMTQKMNFFLLGALAFFGFTQSSLGAIDRKPQATFFQLEGLSPLNDQNYFKALMHRYEPKAQKKTVVRHKKYKKIELYGLKTIIRPIVNGKKILAPKRFEIRNPYVDTLNKTIPGGLGPTQSEDEVIKRFGDQAIQNWLNSPEVRNSTFGKAATQVESAMKVEASIQSAPMSPGEPPIDHKFSFQYLALQSQTKMAYKGWANAMVTIDSGKSITSMEISERVFHNKDLVLSHITTPLEEHSSMGLRWSW
ncbi:MAG: hypothetical protein KDD45_04735 [Bdellovibrionales bacterium]|nr:hypothetical protein [Bdellovibrionales bacterium]